MATEWMTPAELSKLTGLSLKTLTNLRSQYRRFPFYRLEGSKTPVYKRSEIDSILQAARVEVRP